MKDQWKMRDAVLNMFVGAFMALIFLGLPLAIIGLFIASTLDRRGGRPPQSLAASQELLASGPVANRTIDRRRRIIYGQYPVGATTSGERDRPTYTHSGKV